VLTLTLTLSLSLSLSLTLTSTAPKGCRCGRPLTPSLASAQAHHAAPFLILTIAYRTPLQVRPEPLAVLIFYSMLPNGEFDQTSLHAGGSSSSRSERPT
jgi:hypothetical protein